MEKLTFDGAHTPYESLYAWKFAEVTNYTAQMPFATWGMFWVMNWDLWNSFPPELQDVIESVSGDWVSERHDAYAVYREAEIKKQVMDMGHEVWEPSEAEKDRWNAAVQPVIE